MMIRCDHDRKTRLINAYESSVPAQYITGGRRIISVSQPVHSQLSSHRSVTLFSSEIEDIFLIYIYVYQVDSHVEAFKCISMAII